MNLPIERLSIWVDQLYRYEVALKLIRDNPHGISDRDTIARMRDIATKALKE